ncbi:hypothetical protein HGRIS_006270 [Hohenbuehelia grisea]|uniref:Uncharacterized protein n=1 Tax=Hohenbuehelia grisea TaxID=104357 RepID=A0ABR3K0P8_9AGAR
MGTTGQERDDPSFVTPIAIQIEGIQHLLREQQEERRLYEEEMQRREVERLERHVDKEKEFDKLRDKIERIQVLATRPTTVSRQGADGNEGSNMDPSAPDPIAPADIDSTEKLIHAMRDAHEQKQAQILAWATGETQISQHLHTHSSHETISRSTLTVPFSDRIAEKKRDCDRGLAELQMPRER